MWYKVSYAADADHRKALLSKDEEALDMNDSVDIAKERL